MFIHGHDIGWTEHKLSVTYCNFTVTYSSLNRNGNKQKIVYCSSSVTQTI